MIKVTYNKDTYSTDVIHVPFQSRGVSAMRMFDYAWRTYPKDSLPQEPVYFYLNLRDTHEHYLETLQPHERMFHICDLKEQRDQCFPCFTFDRWVETNIPDFDQTVQQIRQAGATPPVINKMFWIGANTHQSRVRLAKIAQQHPDLIDARIMSWGHGMHTSSYTSLPDHTKYKYLIDIEGGGYSARTKFLLHTNRLLFLQDRPFWDWCVKDLQPWKHYVPVRNDLSDLVEKIRWAMEHEEEAQQIVRNMDEYALAYCNRIAAIQHIQDLIFGS